MHYSAIAVKDPEIFPLDLLLEEYSTNEVASLRPFQGKANCIEASLCGNESLLINHSDTPNLIVVEVIDEYGLPHQAFYAFNKICKGDELKINYGKAYWAIRKSKKFKPV